MTSQASPLTFLIADNPLKSAFLKWQCRVRQQAMRLTDGRPDDGVMPAVFLPDETEALGHVITVLNKTPDYSQTAEMRHMTLKTNDPAQTREQALRFLSATYYQKPKEFSEVLTATFPPGSDGAARIGKAGECRLVFDAYSQRFDLTCSVRRRQKGDPLYEATLAHNRLFNPGVHPDTEVLGFLPDWDRSSSDPEYR